MVTGAEDLFALLVHQEAAHRQASGDSLRKRHRVGLDSVLLEAEQGARTAYASLHLIHKKQPVSVRAQIRQRLDEVRIQRQHAALPLNQFH